MQRTTIRPGGRLDTIASMVRPGCVAADVGTDHAYLAILLTGSGRARKVIASDVRRGPVRKAEANVRLAHMEERILVRLADGLSGIEADRPDDIIIAGMGGETIASILAASPYVKREGVRLLLQPMTKASHLRQYLISEGFAIDEERLAEEEGRIYQIMACRWCGVGEKYTPLELLCGRQTARDDLTRRHYEKVGDYLADRLNGKRSAGENTEAEEELLCELANCIDTLTRGSRPDCPATGTTTD